MPAAFYLHTNVHGKDRRKLGFVDENQKIKDKNVQNIQFLIDNRSDCNYTEFISNHNEGIIDNG